MKAYYLLVTLCAALLGGCTTYTYTPVAYTTPATVAYASPTYIAPPYTVVLP